MYKYNYFYLVYLLKLSQSFAKLGNNKQRGFTLLELLITVIIIGILSAISIPAYVATVDKFHYAEAKIQMGCLKRELEGYRIEKGYFPPDVNRDTIPTGIECFTKNNTNLVPYNSKYDYENWIIRSECIIQITFLGKDGNRNFSANKIYSRETGFYQNKAQGGDDLLLIVGFYSPQECKS